MDRSFGEQVASESWFDEANEWIRDRLARHQIRVTGTIERHRSRPWSAHLRASTEEGTVWFKAGCPSMAFEPALQQLLAELLPGQIQPPIEIDAERGWMVTWDHGPTVADDHEVTIRDWQEAVVIVADMQQRLMPHRDRLLATGLPDCDPITVKGRFRRLVDVLAELPSEHPSHLSDDDIADLMSVQHRVVQAADALAAAPIGSSWQHGDLHPGNLFGSGHQLRVFDLGDGQWAHAFEVLVVPYSNVVRDHPNGWARLRDACLEVWQMDRDQFEALWSAVTVTQPVNRALTWHAALAHAGTADMGAWGGNARHHLMRVRDG